MKGKSGAGSAANRASALIGQTIRKVLMKRTVLISLAVLLIPAYISTYSLIDTPEEFTWTDNFADIYLFLVLQVLLLLFCLVYGTSIMNEEIEKRTITYLSTRGLKRFEVVLYKWSGLVISVSVLFFLTITINYLILSMHEGVGSFFDHISLLFSILFVTFVGVAAYTSLFLLFGTTFRRPLMIGLLFSFFWEIFIVNLETNVRKVTLMYYLRSLVYREVAVGNVLEFSGMATSIWALTVLSALTVVFILASILVFRRKDLN